MDFDEKGRTLVVGPVEAEWIRARIGYVPERITMRIDLGDGRGVRELEDVRLVVNEDAEEEG